MARDPLKSFENAALSYLERFSVSSMQLSDFLKRRLLRHQKRGTVFPDDLPSRFPEIIQKMVRLGYIDDARLKDRLIEILRQEGRSTRYIQMKLRQRGLPADIDADPEDELAAARHYAVKKKLADLPKEKALARMARAGFSYAVAKEILDL